MKNWNDPNTPPAMRGPGIPSAPVIVLLDNGEQIPAEFWQSSIEGQSPKWYMSKEILRYDWPYIEICNTVIGWLPISIVERIVNGVSVLFAEDES